ncbi:MAG: glycosyltransferase [Roseovarius sp.]|nr:glycosyltransferase [Roseovarius sp.]
MRRLSTGPLDLVLIHREASLLSRGSTESRLIDAAGMSALDIDDALHLSGSRPGLRRHLLPTAAKTRRLAASVDRVIAGNDYLADWASTIQRDVRVIPTCVDSRDHSLKTNYAVSGPPIIGWIGSAATEIHLASILPALDELHRRTDCKLEVISGPGEDCPFGVPYARRIVWTPAGAHRLANWDVGLMPLPDEPYERGKCAYKFLQYLATGLPAVVSPVGANADIAHRAGALTATSADDWVLALMGLLTMADQDREQMGRQGRAVAADFGYERWAPTWIAAVAGSPRRPS